MFKNKYVETKELTYFKSSYRKKGFKRNNTLGDKEYIVLLLSAQTPITCHNMAKKTCPLLISNLLYKMNKTY